METKGANAGPESGVSRDRIREILASRGEGEEYFERLKDAFDNLWLPIKITIGKVEGGDKSLEDVSDKDLAELRKAVDEFKALLP